MILRSGKFNRQEGRGKREEAPSYRDRGSGVPKLREGTPSGVDWQPDIYYRDWRRYCLICIGCRGLV